jgi:hypothetical protein
MSFTGEMMAAHVAEHRRLEENALGFDPDVVDTCKHAAWAAFQEAARIFDYETERDES